MRVVIVSKALTVGVQQRKAEEIAKLGVELTVLIPPAWQDRRGRQIAEHCYTQGYRLQVIPIVFNGNFHLHFYPTLYRELAKIRPQLLHIDEEPYNLATYLGMKAARQAGAVGTFFTWQNLYRRYPPPFRWFENFVYRNTPVALAGNQAAAAVLRQKGYRGEIITCPQFGVDPNLFTPTKSAALFVTDRDNCLRIGYAGGLLPEKGVDLLLQACVNLRGPWQLQIAGEGSEQLRLQQLAQALDIAQNIYWLGRMGSSQMPAFYQNLDVLVLPSRTLTNWKEQFGRVLIEAMASEVAVIGSSSGEIPYVIGEAGLVFEEGNVSALCQKLQQLLDEPVTCMHLKKAGRARVLAHYTMRSVAMQTVEVYKTLCTLRSTRNS